MDQKKLYIEMIAVFTIKEWDLWGNTSNTKRSMGLRPNVKQKIFSIFSQKTFEKTGNKNSTFPAFKARKCAAKVFLSLKCYHIVIL